MMIMIMMIIIIIEMINDNIYIKNNNNDSINVKNKDINDENNGYDWDGKYGYKDIYNDKNEERNDE